jgi:hypothetical protein
VLDCLDGLDAVVEALLPPHPACAASVAIIASAIRRRVQRSFIDPFLSSCFEAFSSSYAAHYARVPCAVTASA